jgi:hypothetical protein
MFIKSLTLAAVLALTPAAASVLGFSESAQAQNQGGGGATSGSNGGSGAVESPRGIAMFATVPGNQRRPQTEPPQMRRSPSLPNHCALQVHSDGRTDCRNL